MGWLEGSFDAVLLNGVDRGVFDNIWGKHMQLWIPDLTPREFDCFMVTELQLVTNGTMGMHCKVLDENGAPLQGVAVAQGWDNPDKQLPGDSIPNGGDPREYPNRGDIAFSTANGITEWIWGPGEGFAPENKEGPHWYWIPKGPSGIYTDVVYGFGWRLGTNHYHLEPTFQRLGKETPPPVPGDLEARLKVLFADLADAFEKASL